MEMTTKRGISLAAALLSSTAFATKSPHWVARTDAELTSAIKATCELAVANDQPVLLDFSAPWCGDCKLLLRLAQESPLREEKTNWQVLTVDVGRFDKHPSLLQHFGVDRIAYWVALTPPSSCDTPVTEWNVLKKGSLEPASGANSPRTSPAVAAWLSAARTPTP